MVTGLVTAYTYLDSEGVPSWGMVIPKDQRIIATNAIVGVARRVTSQWVDEMLFEDNN